MVCHYPLRAAIEEAFGIPEHKCKNALCIIWYLLFFITLKPRVE